MATVQQDLATSVAHSSSHRHASTTVSHIPSRSPSSPLHGRSLPTNPKVYKLTASRSSSPPAWLVAVRLPLQPLPSLTHPDPHELANVLSSHPPEGRHGVLVCGRLGASPARCCCCCWLAVCVCWVVGDALLGVDVHVVAARQGGGQLVDAALVDGGRLYVWGGGEGEGGTNSSKAGSGSVQTQIGSGHAESNTMDSLDTSADGDYTLPCP